MKIGIDLRFLQPDNHYSNFVADLVAKLISIDTSNSYTIYLSAENKSVFPQGAILSYTEIKNRTLGEQTQFRKILTKADHHLLLFFDFWKPISYKKQYFVFIPSLKDIFYQSFGSGFEKWSYFTMIGHSIKHANKIVVFDEISKQELSERFNIAEERIFLSPGSFKIMPLLEEIDIDLAVTWDIQTPYLIYPGGDGIEKNLERLASLVFKLKQAGKNISLVILGDNASHNIALRDKIIEHKLQKFIIFTGSISQGQTQLLYKQSQGVIYPSLYETFSFDLSIPLHLNTPIIASNLAGLKQVLGSSISYFSPISSSSMLEQTIQFLDNKPEANYTSILGKYSDENSAKNLKQIIDL